MLTFVCQNCDRVTGSLRNLQPVVVVVVVVVVVTVVTIVSSSKKAKILRSLLHSLI